MCSGESCVTSPLSSATKAQRAHRRHKTHDSCCNNNRKLYQLLQTTRLLVQHKSQLILRRGVAPHKWPVEGCDRHTHSGGKRHWHLKTNAQVSLVTPRIRREAEVSTSSCVHSRRRGQNVKVTLPPLFVALM